MVYALTSSITIKSMNRASIRHCPGQSENLTIMGASKHNNIHLRGYNEQPELVL